LRWTTGAEDALSRAPWFVRKMASRRVEEHVRREGRDVVTRADVDAARRGFLARAAEPETAGDAGEQVLDQMSAQELEALVERTRRDSEAAGVETADCVLRVCGGAVGCPRAMVDLAGLRLKVLEVLEAAQLEPAIRRRRSGPILQHHKFKVSLSACTNACSEPQIRDFGVIGQTRPGIGEPECTQCGKCVETCRDGAIELGESGPRVDYELCSLCGDCIRVCPVEYLAVDRAGYAVLLGGHLGRTPKLAVQATEMATEDEVLAALERSLELFKSETRPHERFRAMLERVGIHHVVAAPRDGHPVRHGVA